MYDELLPSNSYLYPGGLPISVAIADGVLQVESMTRFSVFEHSIRQDG